MKRAVVRRGKGNGIAVGNDGISVISELFIHRKGEGMICAVSETAAALAEPAFKRMRKNAEALFPHRYIFKSECCHGFLLISSS